MAPAKPEVFHADHAHHREAVTALPRHQAPTALDLARHHHLEVTVETADRRIEAEAIDALRTVEVEVAFQAEAVAVVAEVASDALLLTSLSTSTATLSKQRRKKSILLNTSLLILDFQLPLLHL